LKVLSFFELFWPYIGGGEVFGAKLMSDLQRYGHEVAVITSHDYLDLPDEARYNNIPIYRLPFRAALKNGHVHQLAELCRRVKRLKLSFNPDVIHVNAVCPVSMLHLRTAHVTAAPVVLRMNQEALVDEMGKANTLTRQALESADWVCCVSSAVLAKLQSLFPAINGRSSVIHNGVELPTIVNDAVPVQAPRLLCLGRLVPAKGFDLAVAALASIAARYPNLRMVIAGDGPERAKMERQVAQLDLSRIVEFIGWVEPDRVLPLISTASIVLIPSWREGLPTVALQAGLMGRPIIATRVGGLPEVVLHHQTGLLCEKGDGGGIADAIAYLLDHPKRAVEMGQEARRRVGENFLWERCVAAYDSLYRQLTSEGGYQC
jgi:glycogen(starch) synthase